MNGMLPILFESDETKFETQGIGVLSGALSCDVTEERNGIFELEMQYPVTGIHFDEIKNRRILFTIPSPYRLPQPFRIYRITKPLNGICTVYAQHIAYDLGGVPLNPFSASSAPQAMLGLQTNAAIQSGFKFWTDKETVSNFAVTAPSGTRSVLGGKEGSILDVYGGEFEWDKFTVKLHSRRGQDNGVTIRYGKNLTDIEQDQNISNLYTGIYPFWIDTEGNELVVCDPKIISAPGTYDFQRILPVDFSQDFQEKPTPEQLKTKAEAYITSSNVGIPTVSITASFAQLEQTEEYRHLALLEKCDLCDTVTVQFEQLGIDVKAKIVKIQTDCLTGKYKQVEIGEAKTNIADTIAGQGQEIQERPTNGAVENIANQIAATIMGAKGGAVRILDTNDDGMPDTLYIADNPDPTQAKKVWRFNFEGWGASATGYNGPFVVAATIEEGMYADFITAGIINAALIKAGILSSKDGKSFWNFDTGQIQLQGDFKTVNGDYAFDFWAAVLSLKDKENLRARIYTTGTKESAGLVQVFSGLIKEDGTKDETTRYSFLSPTALGVGETQDGTYTGTVNTGTVNTKTVRAGGSITTNQAVEFNAAKPNNAQNTLYTNWKRATELTQDDWVLVGRTTPWTTKEVEYAD